MVILLQTEWLYSHIQNYLVVENQCKHACCLACLPVWRQTGVCVVTNLQMLEARSDKWSGYCLYVLVSFFVLMNKAVQCVCVCVWVCVCVHQLSFSSFNDNILEHASPATTCLVFQRLTHEQVVNMTIPGYVKRDLKPSVCAEHNTNLYICWIHYVRASFVHVRPF